MKSKVLFILLLIIVSKLSIAQSNSDTTSRKLSDKESKELMDQLDKQGAFSNIISGFVDNACKCIDSISPAGKSHQNTSDEVKKCIDKEVSAYQMSKQIMESLKSLNNNKNATIYVGSEQDSKMYKKYYYELERALMDSCPSLKIIVASNNKASKYSASENPEAIKQYNFGAQLYDKQLFEEALPYYKKAVEIDPTFVFAWDNLGICYRHINDFDNAIYAYKKSLAINPYNETSLINLAVVYEYKKEYKKALDLYKDALTKMENKAEAYYGIGRMIISTDGDNEDALENFCEAYTIYVKMNPPYRVDGEKMISLVYARMKKDKKEKKFNAILKKYNISSK